MLGQGLTIKVSSLGSGIVRVLYFINFYILCVIYRIFLVMKVRQFLKVLFYYKTCSMEDFRCLLKFAGEFKLNLKLFFMN